MHMRNKSWLLSAEEAEDDVQHPPCQFPATAIHCTSDSRVHLQEAAASCTLIWSTEAVPQFNDINIRLAADVSAL